MLRARATTPSVGGIVTSFFHCRLHVGGNVLVGFQVVGAVVAVECHVVHGLSPHLRNLFCLRNVLLCGCAALNLCTGNFAKGGKLAYLTFILPFYRYPP
jgi:hypothetical protein